MHLLHRIPALIPGLFWIKYASSVEPVYTDKDHTLQETTCGLWAAYNRGYPDTWDEISACLTRWVELDSSQRKEPFDNAIQKTAFSYIDSGNGHRLVNDIAMPVFQVLPYALVAKYDHKATFQEMARRAGIEGEIVPRAYTTKQEALEAFSADDVDILFVKNPTQTAGEGINVIATRDLPTFSVPDGHLIQEGLTRNLALFGKSRYNVRAHFVALRGILYCHHRGFVQVHDEPFDGLSTSRRVQVSHAGNYAVYNLDMRYPIRTPEFLNTAIVNEVWDNGLFPLESIPNGMKWMENIVRLGQKIGPMLEPVVRATHQDPLRYGYLGIDLIALQDGSLKVLEINTFPAFRRFDVMTDVILQALCMELCDEDLESRLVEVWKLPELSHDEM